jgi:hypothetical protein
MRRLLRALLSASALACTALLLFASARHEDTFRDPEDIFWWFAVPLATGLSSLLLLVLPATGRLALLSSLLVIALFETGFGVVQNVTEQKIQTFTDPEYYQDDENLGYAPKPGIRTVARKHVNGDLVYEVDYEIDGYGRRATPLSPPPGERTRFLLFFGGSCTFGEGLEQDQTLPYLVARQSPGHRPYNYGFHGYGPQQLLANLESGRLSQEVDEEAGTLVYLFIDSHVNRAIGSMVVYNGWAYATPNYVLDASGELSRRGTLTTGRPLRSLLYSILGRSHLLGHFRVELPPRITDRHVDLTARVFARSAALFRRTFGPQRFVVVMFPGSNLAGRLGRALDGLGVEHLDYSDLLDYSEPGYHIPHDWHPTALTNQIIADRFVEDLALAGDALVHK